jgi:hypothetical protein
VTLTAQDRQAATTGARFAARRGAPVTNCPYDPAGDDRNRALALLWITVYRRYRPAAVDYSG